MLNTIILLRRHAGAHAALAAAMGRRESVARCIAVIEANLGDAPLKPQRGEGNGAAADLAAVDGVVLEEEGGGAAAAAASP